MTEILVLDDDLRMRQLITEILSGAGYQVIAVGDGREALIMLKERTYDLVITDLKMPHVDGFDILDAAKKADPETIVVMITAHATVESAIAAIRKGAYDYIQKPFNPDQLVLLIARALEHLKLLNENKTLSEVVKSLTTDDFVGSNHAITSIKNLINKIAPLDTTVLIQGETGTGKELIAKLVHKKSQRADKIFLPINCGSIAETLIESELFGYEKGAFTGAFTQKKGFFETASGGTIFLDEINNTSPAMQVKLLRILQENSIMRVGGTKPVAVDVRVIAASSGNLEEDLSSGRFRKDLFYRVNVVTVKIPPLRDRRDDLPLLAYHFLNKYGRKFKKEIKTFSADALQILLAYAWPGNVRELENVVERTVIIESSPEITPASLPNEIKNEPLDPLSYIGIMKLEEMERFLIERTLRLLDGQKNKAAEALGIDATTLWRKIKKYNLE